MRTRSLRTRSLTARPAALLTAAALIATLALSWAAVAHVGTTSAARHTRVTPTVAHTQLLTAEQAMAQARATKKSVVVSSLTTPTSLTTADPDGLLTLTQTLGPTRVWKPGPGGTGQWVPLSATLVRAGKRLATTATSQPLSLSAGGAGPLAVLSNAGRTLAITWPGSLPTPVVSGATATYRNVLPGVDLVVTANTMGGLTTTLIIHTATAATNPALRSLKLSVSPSPGLKVTADAAGNLAVGAGGNAQPVFTADAPKMWDSAAPSAGTPIVTGSSSDGVARMAQSGLLAYSSATAPGTGAHLSSVPLSVSGDMITLAPLAAALTGPTVVYPLNVALTNFSSPLGTDAWNWAEVKSGVVDGIDTSTQSFWEPSSDLQVGLCYPSPQCNGLLVERSFFTVSIDSSLTGPNVVIFYSHVFMNDQWAAACGQSDNQVNLFNTSTISSSNRPTYNSTNDPTFWNNEIAHQSFAFQDPSSKPDTHCPWDKNQSSNVTWDVTNLIEADILIHTSKQTFGLRANDETSTSLDWHQFVSGAKNITLSTSYNLNPNQPSSLGATGGTVPAVACGTSKNPIPIGHDDVTLSAYESDPDGDTNMTTKVYIVAPTNAGTNLLGTPLTLQPDNHSNTLVRTTIGRTTFTNLHNSAFTYEWWAITTDNITSNGISTKAVKSNLCYFNYDPNGPGQPNILSWAFPPHTHACPGTSPCPIQIPPGQPNLPPPIAIGQSLTVTVGPPDNCSPTNQPCPTSYTYQLGSGQPATANVSSLSTALCNTSSCPMTFTMNQFGPVTLTIAGMTNGNPGTAITPGLQGLAPSPPYTDGYFSGGANPDLLAIGSGSRPSLWVYPGTVPGSLGYGIDIGSEGTGINPGTDGPADWSNVKTNGTTITTIGTAQVAHGDFTRHGVQDVIAYYPPVVSGATATYGDHAGVGVLIPGPGIDATLQAQSANGNQIDPIHWTDMGFNSQLGNNLNTPPLPINLVGAGNASESSSVDNPTGGDDLVGVYGDPNDGYELALWTTGPGQPGDYGFPFGAGNIFELSPIGTPTPDGNTWDNFSLATVQPPSAQPGVSANATVLFALDRSNGEVWMSANTGCPPTNPTNLCSTSLTNGLIGTSGTWQKLTTPQQETNLKGTRLVSADVNSAGTTELWDVSNGTATAYTVTYPTASNNNIGSITQETSTIALTSPLASWPLADGASNGCSGSSPSSATDDIKGLTANLGTDASWASDGTFGCVLELNGTSSAQAQTSGSLLQNTNASYSVAAWVRLTSTANIGVAVSQDGTQTSGFRLQFQSRTNTWQFIVANTDAASPSLSYAIGTNAGTAPTLDAWTYLVGVYDAGSKTATLYVNGILAGSTSVSSTFDANGPFVMGRGQYGATGAFYWAGDLSQVQAWTSTLTQAQVKALYQVAH